jgi:hypothetical protein
MVASPQIMEENLSVSKGLENWFDYCPAMTPEQQGIIEIMLPVALPAILYMFNISSWGFVWVLVLMVGHSVECLCTDWGGTAWSVVRWIGPLQHLQMDLLWNHAMITSFFLSGPAIFGRNCYYAALCLVPTLPALVVVSLKSHFLSSILADRAKITLNSEVTTSSAGPTPLLLKKKLARQVQQSTYIYVVAMALLALSSFYGNNMTQSISVFFFNCCPLFADFSYWRAFEERIEELPPKRRTLCTRRNVECLRTSLFRKGESRDKVKAA